MNHVAQAPDEGQQIRDSAKGSRLAKLSVFATDELRCKVVGLRPGLLSYSLAL